MGGGGGGGGGLHSKGRLIFHIFQLQSVDCRAVEHAVHNVDKISKQHPVSQHRMTQIYHITETPALSEV